MKGTVQLFNWEVGLGFILLPKAEIHLDYYTPADVVVTPKGEFVKHFVHETNIRMSGLRGLLAGWEVEFDSSPGAKGREARNIVPPEGLPGLTVNELKPMKLADDKVVRLKVEGMRTLELEAELLPRPHVRAGTFTAYAVSGKFEHFRLELPLVTAEQCYFVLDRDKMPMVRPDGIYASVPPRHYYMAMDSAGLVSVFSLGRRYQPDLQQNWAVLELRFTHRYDLRPGAKLWEEQTPTSGLERDNNGFIPAIRVAMQVMEAIREQGE